jgi:hypothetical protein
VCVATIVASSGAAGAQPSEPAIPGDRSDLSIEALARVQNDKVSGARGSLRTSGVRRRR